MEKLNLNDKNLVPLKKSDLLTINGGILPIVAAGAAAAGFFAFVGAMGVCIYVYNNLDDFIEGIKEGYESTQ
jgi:lactobin A/cerein 7B family class IIb bacteriocin